MLGVLSLLLVLFSALCGALALHCRWQCRAAYATNTVGFLHAAAGAGGGGERVLWVALDHLQRADMERKVTREYVVFTNMYEADDRDTTKNATLPSPHRVAQADAALLARVEQQFNVQLRRPVRFVYLRRALTRWSEGESCRVLTLLLQLVLGGCALFYEAAVVHAATPIVIETVGVPVVYPLLRLLCGSVVVSYTHYPFIPCSASQAIAGAVRRPASTRARLARRMYYYLVRMPYSVAGQFPQVVFTNSSWTQNRVRVLYWPRRTTVLYPPCDVVALLAGCEPPWRRGDDIVSVGQFRPEKNHSLQLRAFAEALPLLPAEAKLVLIGGTRDAADVRRVHQLRDEAAALGITSRVLFRVNASVEEVRRRLCTACTGLHTMRDEHFGICVLEYLAAGCLALAHRSGGVELDIINDPAVGFLADTQAEYARHMVEISRMRRESPSQYELMQARAHAHVRQFGDEFFGRSFVDHLQHLLYIS